MTKTTDPEAPTQVQIQAPPDPPPSRTWLFGKPRPLDELLRDKAFPFQIGQLTGAVSMATYLLSMKDDPEVKMIGQRLAERVAWYFEPKT